jgi:predicted dinucleotide-binding enzyme
MNEKIGILGSGPVAQALGAGFVNRGYEVMMGTRNTSKLSDWITSQGGKAKAGTFEEAAKFGDLLVLAVKGKVAHKVLQSATKENLKGKTIMDACNPISDGMPTNGVLSFFTSLDESLMEKLQNIYPEANFVKAYNSVGSSLMIDPPLDAKPTMFICGNNEEAKSVVKKFLDMFGWEAEDMGTAEAARAIEPLCILWCIPGFRENRWNHAFKLLKS